MLLARVIGNVVATRKDEALVGSKLLLVQPIDARRAPVGKPLVAIDGVGAGAGEHVIYLKGREAAHPFLPKDVPTDAAIVGIVDEWHAE
jgi:ethanolamine utilization protein EutN